MRKLSWFSLGITIHLLAVGGLVVFLYAPGDPLGAVLFRSSIAAVVGLLTVAVVAPLAAVAGYRYGARRAFQDSMAEEDNELGRLLARRG